jgi:thioredoxin reductase (NADPH)
MSDEQLDIVVVGGGFAGVAAALGCASDGAPVALLEPMTVGGEAMNLLEVEDLPESVLASGPDLVADLTERVMAAGVDFRLGETASALEREDGGWRVVTDSAPLLARVVVIASGADPLGLPDSPEPVNGEVHGEGIFSCAACDAPLYAGLRVAVAGGGDTGVGAAITLSPHAGEVVLFERGNELTARDSLRRRLAELPNVELRLGCEVLGTEGEGSLEAVRVAGAGGEVPERADGVMLAVGMRPRSRLVAGHVELDDAGAIRVNPSLETSAPGLYAAGDVREGSAWRFAAAWGDGQTVARSALLGLKAEITAR